MNSSRKPIPASNHPSRGGAGNSTNDIHADSVPSEEKCFCLFPASIAHFALQANCADSSIDHVQTAQAKRDEYAVRRLTRLLEERNDEDHSTYSKFVLRGPYNFASEEIWYQTLTISSTVASAIVDFFELEVSPVEKEVEKQPPLYRCKRHWKCLQLWDCTPNEALFQVLESSMRLGLFEELEIKKMGVLHSSFLTRIFQNNSHCNAKSHLKSLTLEHVRQMDPECASVLGGLLNNNQGVSPDPTSAYTFERLWLHEIVLSDNPWDIQPLQVGLNNNKSLLELTLSNVSSITSSTDNYKNALSLCIQSLVGHPSLRNLALPHNLLLDDTLTAIAALFQHPACKIRSLDLSHCTSKTTTNSRTISSLGETVAASPTTVLHSLRMDSVISLLQVGRCSTLSNLKLARNRMSSRDLTNLLLVVVDSCPQLREIDMSQNQIERITFTPTELDVDARYGALYLRNQSLERLWLTRNPIMHNRFRIRMARDNERMERMLCKFSALGQIVPHDTKFRVMPYPLNICRIFAFNHASRGKLTVNYPYPQNDQSHCHYHLQIGDNTAAPIAMDTLTYSTTSGSPSPSLWPLILKRIDRAVQCVQPFLQVLSTYDNEDFVNSIQASLLFLLFRNDPSTTATIFKSRILETKDVDGDREITSDPLVELGDTTKRRRIQ